MAMNVFLVALKILLFLSVKLCTKQQHTQWNLTQGGVERPYPYLVDVETREANYA